MPNPNSTIPALVLASAAEHHGKWPSPAADKDNTSESDFPAFFFLKKGAQWRSLYTHHLFLALQGVSRLAIPRGLSPPQFQLRINPVAAALAVNTQDSLHPLLVLIAHNYLTH